METSLMTYFPSASAQGHVIRKPAQVTILGKGSSTNLNILTRNVLGHLIECANLLQLIKIKKEIKWTQTIHAPWPVHKFKRNVPIAWKQFKLECPKCKAYFYKFYSQRLLLQAAHFAKPQLQKAGNTRERAHFYKMHSCKQDTDQNEGYQKLTFWGHLHRTHFCMTRCRAV